MFSRVIKQFQNHYPFPLDTFQVEAIKALLDGKSVLVTAPTGSGKTVVAEFTVFDSLDRNLKTIYTTPLKALSNQKYRDLSEQYGAGNIGLLTGDVSLNPDAPILVMTTEILRNILYQDISRLDDVLYVVLDECHYMNDKERGTVWEEVIIHCPRHILFVALSATIDNAKEVASWVTSIHNKIVVIEHLIRPVPTKHLFYTDGRLYNLLNEKNQPITKFFKYDKRRPNSDVNPLNLVLRLNEDNLLPAIYFVFSRRGCDMNMTECLEERIRLTTNEERKQIQKFTERFMSEYPSLEDTSPITRKLLMALPNGVAIHHAGLVPVLRHLVELLFQRNLIKVVFATETLAAGINMPARTTVISSLSKKSDNGHEILSVNSFQQMVGRAGRRGKDMIGYCVVVNDGRSPYSEAVRLVHSNPDPIRSNFALSYNMVLNLLKNFSWENITEILQKSFGQYLNNKEIIDLQLSLEQQQEQLKLSLNKENISTEDEIPILEYENIKLSIENQENLVRQIQEEYESKHFQKMQYELSDAKKGTVIAIKTVKEPFPILASLIIKYFDRTSNRKLLNLIVLSNKGITRVTPNECLIAFKPGKRYEIPDYILAEAYSLKIGKWHRDNKLPKPFSKTDNRKYLSNVNLKLYPSQLNEEIETLHYLRENLIQYEIENRDTLETQLSSHLNLKHLTSKINMIKDQIESQRQMYIEDFRKLMNILVHYEQIEENSQGEYKPTKAGLITSYIRAENELVIALLINKGLFEKLKPVEIAAVLSSVVYEPRRSVRVRLDNVPGIIVSRIDEIHNIVSDLEYVQSMEGVEKRVRLEPGMVTTIWLWGNGSPWKKLFKNNTLDDGDVIRCIRRVIDLLHQLKNIPDISRDLQSRLSEAVTLLDRDLISVNIEEEKEEEGNNDDE